MQVIKATGEKEEFSEEKVLQSIKRARIPVELQPTVLNHVKEKIYENIPTSEIYNHILEFLEKSDKPYSKSKYSLKQAIMALGPTGYPFEDYVAEILKTLGYSTEVRQVLKGTCIMHEIDVVATKENEKIMVEVKFHNGPGTRTDSQNALYTKARFDDIKQSHQFTKAWLVTNTKATIDAITYGQCVGMEVIGWSYPDGKSIRDLIENSYLTPITALSTLSQAQKAQLLEQHIVLCKDICNDPRILNLLFLKDEEKDKVMDEIHFVCNVSK